VFEEYNEVLIGTTCVRQVALLSHRGRTMLRVYQLLQLQIYHCVQLNSVLLSSA